MEGLSEKFVIQLLIGRQHYPVAVRREAEGTFRDAAKLINKVLAKYEGLYPNQGHEKYMAMTVLEIAVNLLQLRDEKDTSPYHAALEQLTQELEAVLAR